MLLLLLQTGHQINQRVTHNIVQSLTAYTTIYGTTMTAFYRIIPFVKCTYTV